MNAHNTRLHDKIREDADFLAIFRATEFLKYRLVPKWRETDMPIEGLDEHFGTMYPKTLIEVFSYATGTEFYFGDLKLRVITRDGERAYAIVGKGRNIFVPESDIVKYDTPRQRGVPPSDLETRSHLHRMLRRMYLSEMKQTPSLSADSVSGFLPGTHAHIAVGEDVAVFVVIGTGREQMLSLVTYSKTLNLKLPSGTAIKTKRVWSGTTEGLSQNQFSLQSFLKQYMS